MLANGLNDTNIGKMQQMQSKIDEFKEDLAKEKQKNKEDIDKGNNTKMSNKYGYAIGIYILTLIAVTMGTFA